MDEKLKIFEARKYWSTTTAGGVSRIAGEAVFAAIIFSCYAYIAWISFFVVSPGRSFWYDEVNLALLLSERGWLDILSADFFENYARPPAFNWLSKMLLAVSNDQSIVRISNVVPFTILFFGSVLLSFRRRSLIIAAFFAVFFIISENYAAMLTTFKPYVWDAAAAVICLVALDYYTRGISSYGQWLGLLTCISSAALFSHLAWPVMLILCALMVWHELRSPAKDSSPWHRVFSLFTELLKGKNAYYFAYITIVWFYLVQSVLRAFFFGDPSITYDFVESQNTPPSILLTGNFFLHTIYDVIERFLLLQVSADMPFFLFPEARSGLPLVIFLVFLLGLTLGQRLSWLLYSYFAISLFLKLLVDWPFDSERWSMALGLLVITPVSLLALQLYQKRVLTGVAVVLIAFLLQVPFKSHPSGIWFHSEGYQMSRVHPSTMAEDILIVANRLLQDQEATVIGSSNSLKFVDYYSLFADGRDYQALAGAERMRLQRPFGESVANLPEGVYLMVHFHNFRGMEGVDQIIQENCQTLHHIGNGEVVGDVRYLRSYLRLFECSGSQP